MPDPPERMTGVIRRIAFMAAGLAEQERRATPPPWRRLSAALRPDRDELHEDACRFRKRSDK
jgi:hypothetical protein